MSEVNVRALYFEIPSLLQRIETEVLYKSRNKGSVLGIGENSIVDAEILVKEYLGAISSEIFSKLISRLSRQVPETDSPEEPYEFDVTFDNNGTNIEHCIVYRIILPEKFDEITMPSIIKSIELSMVSYCVWQWLMDSNVQGWEKYEQQHLAKFNDLRDLTLRRVNLKRTYKLY